MNAATTSNGALARLIDHFGGKRKAHLRIAAALDCHPESVRLWLYKRRTVPAKRAVQLEQITDGLVRAVDLVAEA